MRTCSYRVCIYNCCDMYYTSGIYHTSKLHIMNKTLGVHCSSNTLLAAKTILPIRSNMTNSMCITAQKYNQGEKRNMQSESLDGQK